MAPNLYRSAFLNYQRSIGISKSTKSPEYTDGRVLHHQGVRWPNTACTLRALGNRRCRRSVTEVKTTKNDDQRNTIKITKIRPVQLAKITAYFYRELLRTGPGSTEELERQTHSYDAIPTLFLQQVLLYSSHRIIDASDFWTTFYRVIVNTKCRM